MLEEVTARASVRQRPLASMTTALVKRCARLLLRWKPEGSVMVELPTVTANRMKDCRKKNCEAVCVGMNLATRKACAVPSTNIIPDIMAIVSFMIRF